MDDLSSAALLKQYAEILQELKRRGVVRTNNAPLGDYAEYLAQRVYGGVLQPNSNKSYDLLTEDGVRVQVKARTLGLATRPQAKFSPFRSFDFDAAVFVALDLSSYSVLWARQVSVPDVEAAVRYSAHVNGSTVRIGTAAKLGSDVTALFTAAAQP